MKKIEKTEIENNLKYNVYIDEHTYTYLYKEYWLNNKLHRENGPARIFGNFHKEYWLNDIHYSDIKTDDEWLIFQML